MHTVALIESGGSMTGSHARARRPSALLLALLLASGGFSLTAAPTLTPDSVAYLDACDGSAAIALSSDTFVVAHDDDNVLRGYKVGTGAPLFTRPLETFLEAKKEVDIEGAARIGDIVYWIGSHGRDSKGNPEPTRLTFFATHIGSQTTLEPEGKPYRKLLDTFIKPLLAKKGFPKAFEQAPESPGGLNIEGLAPMGDHLLVAFRNPLPGGRALVAELTNPKALVTDPSIDATPGRVFELDLGGRGIRGLELISNEQGYLLVAGPFDKGDSFDPAKGRFVVHRWTPDAAPRPVDTVKFPANFRPESLFLTPSSAGAAGMWTVLADDGDEKIDGVTCKDVKPKSNRRFRRATFTLD
jgi:hypothetical protein